MVTKKKKGAKPRKKPISQNSEQKSEAQKRKLANLKPFKPGQSGNPGGRPRKIITEGFDDILSEVVVRRKKRDTRLRHMLRAIVDEAIAGKIPAFSEITDRIEGKAMQAHQVSGPGGGAIQVESMSREQREKRISELLAKRGGKTE